ncbi:MAG TPA: hypothetical protein VKM93_07800 [Terriglobia bacterium]|nr:hypothetical protein [Terriglobia bacterium]
MQYTCGTFDPKFSVWRSEPARGGSVRLVLGVAAFSVLVFIIVRSVPFLVADFQLGMQLEDVVAHDSAARAPNEVIRANVVRCAENLGLPVTADNVTVTGGGGYVSVKVDYTVEVDLKVYTWVIYFSDSSNLHPV